MTEKLLTREQWEAQLEEERAGEWLRTRYNGNLGGAVYLLGSDQDRMTPEQLESLLDCKLAQLKEDLLARVAERKAALDSR